MANAAQTFAGGGPVRVGNGRVARAVPILHRFDLYGRLDLAEEPGLWISAPCGFGKTSLVRGYLQSRDYHALWHGCDAVDGDLATFLSFLKRAFSRAFPELEPLPPLGPDTELSVFTRELMEALFERAPKPFALVFDDFHEIPAGSPTVRAIASLVESLPPQAKVVFVGRTPAPPELTRLLVNRRVAELEPTRLRFSLEEAHALALLQGVENRALVRDLHRLVEGWAAGLVLLMRRGIEGCRPTHRTREEIFDYLMCEVMQRIDTRTHDFLVRSAFLPTMTAAMALRQTGMEEAGEILARFHSESFFTTCSREPQPLYSYDPVFREFLLRYAAGCLPPGEEDGLRRRAAESAEAAGEIEEAARLWRASGCWDELVRMICSHAKSLVERGRSDSLQKWLAALPAKMILADPWLSYWAGVSMLHESPVSARAHFLRARLFFERTNDWAGALAACTSGLQTFLVELGDLAGCDPWLDALDELLATAPAEIPIPLQLRIVEALEVVAYRDPSRPLLARWAERAKALVTSLPAHADRLAAAAGIRAHACWDDPRPFGAAIEEASRCARMSEVPTARRAWWGTFESDYRALRGDFGRARETLEQAMELSRNHELRALEGAQHEHMAYLAIATGDATLARSSLEAAAGASDAWGGTRAMRLTLLQSQVALLEGNLMEATTLARAAVELGGASNMPVGVAACHIAAAAVAIEAKRYDEAEEHLRGADAVAARVGMGMLFSQADLGWAHLAIARGDLRAAEAPLRRGLSAMCRRGYPVWDLLMRPKVASLLAGAALELGVETDFVLEVIRLRSLRPEATAGRSWPRDVRIETLGGFRLSVRGEPVSSSGKAQRRPLDLLKLVIAAGGRQVPTSRIADSLWSDADGDAAAQALKTTIHRLRHILKDKECVVVHDGRVSLSPSLCFVDCLFFLRDCQAIEEELHAIGSAGSDLQLQRAQRILASYSGHFLPGEQPHLAEPMRENLRRSFQRLALLAGEEHERRGDPRTAADLYERCLSVDPEAKRLRLRLGRSRGGAKAA